MTTTAEVPFHGLDVVDGRCNGTHHCAPPVRGGRSRVASSWTVAPILASSTASTARTPGGGSHSRLAVRRRPWRLIRSNNRLPRRSTPSSTPSSASVDVSPGPEDSIHWGGQTVALPDRSLRSRSFMAGPFVECSPECRPCRRWSGRASPRGPVSTPQDLPAAPVADVSLDHQRLEDDPAHQVPRDARAHPLES